jgi:GT2 family glycosyltransferase/SAM-dependent methyltransferase
MIADPVAVVIPNWNGRRWLLGCLQSLARQSATPEQVIVVDNGSDDGSVEWLRAEHPAVEVVEIGWNSGFAHAANRGLAAASCELVALVNTDVELADDWVSRMAAALAGDPGAAAVACKMLSLEDPTVVYDAGDVLRRDGACEQRGRFGRDDGRWDRPGEVFGACAGAAMYRRGAVLAVGGFDERYFAYLEDVDLALRLRLAGWRCLYEPAVALHAGEGASSALVGGHRRLVVRNTLVLVTKAFPVRWLPLVMYRQLGWAWHALLERRLAEHVRALAAAIPMLPGALRARRTLRAGAAVAIEAAIPAVPYRAPMVTGERVSTSRGGFNPSFQRHRAEYRLAAAMLGPGRVLDLGCGTGHSFEELAPRPTVGVDVEAAALAGQERETVVADMRSLPFADGSFGSVVSIQSIEHVPDPERVLAEAARVLESGGRAVFVTPNRLTFGRADEIIDPYHYVEFDAAQLRALCAPFFESVEVLGLQVSDRYRAIHDDERVELERLLSLDPLRLRRMIPRRLKQVLYDRRLSGDRVTPRPGAQEITIDDFRVESDGLADCIDLFAVCDRPLGSSSAAGVSRRS